jgi:hypothetical protein
MKAVQMCLNRFDDETKTAFLDFYSKIDVDALTQEDDIGENESVDTVG